MAPGCFVLTARRGGAEARFAVVPCADGWYEHFLNGDRALRRYHRYVSDESLHDLVKWWQCEFDRHHLVPAPDVDQMREDLRHVWTWPETFVHTPWSEACESPA